MFSMDYIPMNTFGALTNGEEKPEAAGSECQRTVDVDRDLKGWTVGTLGVLCRARIGMK